MSKTEFKIDNDLGKKKNIVEYLHELEAKAKPKVVHTEDPMAIGIEPMIEKKDSKDRSKRKRRRVLIKICPNCSKIMVGDKKKCPSCGYTLF